MKSILLKENNIILLIILNSIIIFLNGYSFSPNINYLLSITDDAISFLFLLEAFFKIKENKWNYFKSNWNILDFTLILISIPSIISIIYPITGDFSFLLIFRILRVFKLFRFFRFIPNIDDLLIGFKNALKSSILIIASFLIYILIIGLLSNYMFSYSQYFSTPTNSLYSILKIFTLEDWYVFQEELSIGLPNWKSFMINLYFIFILISGGVFGVSLINSIFVESMIRDGKNKTNKKLEDIESKLDMLINKK
jgi:voltage-gated sodium channel